MRRSTLALDRYALYEASVQGEYDLDFAERMLRDNGVKAPRLLREDFCGTAMLASTWAARSPRHFSMGLDLDPEPLAWGRRHHLLPMRDVASRVHLMRRDVRTVTRPRVDVVLALNFSYWVFKRRADLLRYFRDVRRSLKRRGVFVVNAFGGTETMGPLTERRRVAASQAPDGLRLPAFTYVWEQERFNPITHEILCHIHFELPGGRRMRRAFTYDWRLWTLPEVREVMAEAGFRDSGVFTEGWSDAKNRPGGGYRKRDRFDNQEGWLAYVVGVT